MAATSTSSRFRSSDELGVQTATVRAAVAVAAAAIAFDDLRKSIAPFWHCRESFGVDAGLASGLPLWP